MGNGRKIFQIISGALVISLIAGVSTSCNAKPAGDKYLGSDGKEYSIKELAKGKPTYLYFIHASCPINAQAVKFYNNLSQAYKGKINFFGVIDGGQTVFAAWQKKFNVGFPLLFDPNSSLKDQYGARRSPWFVQLDREANAKKFWPGYSFDILNEINLTIANSAGMKQALKVDLYGSPERLRAG